MSTVSWFTLAQALALVTQVLVTQTHNKLVTDRILAWSTAQLGFHLTACACRTTKYETRPKPNRNLIAA